ncbi:MAG: ATP-binding domain-containing protein [Clostridia bacterium]
MARMIPAVPREFDERSREDEMFHALEMLPEDYTVVHSFRVIRVENNVIHESESDFVIIHPEKGVLFLEAKASRFGYSYRNGIWYYGSSIPMKYGGPMEEALRAKRNFERKLFDAGKAEMLTHCRVDSGVWLISISRGQLEQMTLPADVDKRLFLTEESLLNITHDIERVFEVHRYEAEKTALSAKAVESLLTQFICPAFDLVRSNGTSLTDKRLVFNRLLEEQSRLLDYLVDQPTGVINGAAGTGKTMLGVEMARRYSVQGERTLFLCYNKKLCEYLQESTPFENVDYYSIDAYTVKITPSHTINYSELYQALLDTGDCFPYQHIIVDEGQDFGKELIEDTELFNLFEMLVTATNKIGTFYVFYDSNQLIQANAMPAYIEHADCRLTLYRNSRNTHCIAQTSAVPLPDTRRVKLSDKCLEGDPPSFMFAETLDEAKCCLNTMLNKLFTDGYTNIQLLSMTTEEKSVIAPLLKDSCYRHDGLCVPFTTCRKFKGLESDAIILMDVNRTIFEDEEAKRIFYVGTSRARFALWALLSITKEESKRLIRDYHIPKSSNNPQKTIASFYRARYKKMDESSTEE